MKSKINKIVIIDDEESICLLLSHILKKIDLETHCAHTMKEGSTLLETEEPAVIFLDINLPDGSGFDLIPRIKEKLPESKVVMVSAYDDAEEINTATAKGADYFISKPFTVNRVKEVIGSIRGN